MMPQFELNLIIAAGAVVAIGIAIVLMAAERLQSEMSRRFPHEITSRDQWTCRAIAWPGNRYWIVPTSVTEKQVLDALTEVAKTYPGWIPAHRLLGRGVRAHWMLELHRPSPKPIRPERIAASRDQDWIHIGLDLRRKPVAVNAAEHTLVVGLTGSGKGSVMAAWVDAVMDMIVDGQAQLWGIDLKGGVEMSLYNRVFDEHHAYTVDEALNLLQGLSDECDRRMSAMRGRLRKLPPTPEYPRIVLLIDEAAELHGKADRKKSELVTRLLDSILRRGRALGIVVVALSQDPRVESVPLRARFPQRIALRLNSEEEAVMLLGREAVDRGATPWLISPDQQGSGFIWNQTTGTVDYFRAPWYGDDDLMELGA